MDKYVRRFKHYRIIRHILNNFMNMIKLNWKKHNLKQYSTYKDFCCSEKLRYINKVYDDYIFYSGINDNSIIGKDILEIGTGDNLGVALKFIAHGANRVICLDKVYSLRSNKQQYMIYSAMRNSLDSDKRNTFDLAIQFKDDYFELNEEKVKYIYGVGIEEAENIFGEKRFDFIISRAVLEYVYDIDSGFYVMDKLLEKNGYHIHKIDLRDSEVFNGGFNPLSFLTISEILWKYMTKYSIKPNRRRINYYADKLRQFGYEYKIYITYLINKKKEIVPHKENIVKYEDYNDNDIETISKIRPKLYKDFRDLSDEFLLISGIFIVAKKVNLSSTSVV